MKKWFSATLVLVLLSTLVLSGCTTTQAPSGQPAPSGGKKVTIEYWQYTFDSKLKTVDELIKRFEAKNPDIKVEHKNFPYENFQQKVTASVPAGTGPDVVTLFYGWLPKYIAGEYIQPLPEKYFPADKIANEFASVVEASKLDGKYWSLPTGVRSLALIWNKDLFKAAGLDPEKPPKTLDEFVDMAKRLTIRDASGKLIQEGFAFNTSGQGHSWFREVLLPQYGVEILSKDGKTVQWNAKPEAYEAFKWFTDLSKVNKVGEIGFYDDDNKAFTSGKAAMTIDGSFRLGNYKTMPDLNIGVAELPLPSANSTKVNFASYWTHAITKQAAGDKLDAAAKFLQYLTSEEAMELWLTEVGELPARKSFAAREDLVKDPKVGPFLKGMSYAATSFMPDEAGIRQAIIDAVDNVLLKNMDPKAALDQATKQAQAIYDEFYKGRKK